ncbi:MAG: DUF1893 domain-containing protein [Lachnospiraceae bacterium]
MMDTATYKAVNRARVALTHGDKTFVIIGENKVNYYSEKRGMAPLLELLEQAPEKLEGAIIGDRIMGRAAAMLCIFGKVKAIFAMSISDEAIDMFEKHHILATWQETVPYIVERDLKSRYKLDLHIKDEEDPQTAVEMIKDYCKQVCE